MARNDEIPAAFAVARAEFGAIELVRCSCGALYPRGGKCAHAPQGEAVRLFEPAPTQLAGQLDLSMPRVTVAEANAEVRAMIRAGGGFRAF